VQACLESACENPENWKNADMKSFTAVVERDPESGLLVG
jgi:hypothetical protein